MINSTTIKDGFPKAYDFDECDRDKARLRRQWVISAVRPEVDEEWISERLGGGKSLHHHPDLTVERVDLEDDIVFLLGLGVYPERPKESFSTNLSRQSGTSSDRVLASLMDLAGTYVVIHSTGGRIYIYTDPAAMMGVFFHPGMASSSVSLLPPLERDATLDAVFPFGGANDWYPGSLCPYLGIRALIANHRLELDTGKSFRFWPESDFPRLNPEDSKEQTIQFFRGSLLGYSTRGRLLVSLTGGRDSRVNLAASKHIKDELEFFTIRTKKVKSCDLTIPSDLADRFHLNHIFVEAGEAPSWLTGLYDEIAGGMAVGARREILEGCRKIAGKSHIHLNGNLGAITKSFFWDSPAPKMVKLESLAKEFVAKPKEILDGVSEWLKTVPDLSPTTVYNLMYLEQRGGRWMGIGENASSLFYQSATLFNSRQVFASVSGLPADELYGGTLLVEYVKRMWPELLETPYCQVTRNWGTYLPKPLKEFVKKVLRRN